MAPLEDELSRLIRLAREWAAAGHVLALATVVRTWGSSPRRAGSHLLIREDGVFEGSVSGGCVEGEVVVEAQEVLSTAKAKLLEFGVSDETAWRAGLGCGGSVAILVQPIGDCGFPDHLLYALEAARGSGRAFSITFDLAGDPARVGSDPGPTHFVANYDPPRRLAIIGAVHIAQMLAPIARLLGHEVIVIDPRIAFVTGGRFAEETIDSRWPDEALKDFKPDAASAVVSLTHDPKLDDVALTAALRSDAYYVAALGSRINQRRRLDRLRDLGISEADLARLRGPAGLPIGAEGPAEIALAIAAEIVAAWRRVPLPEWPSR